MRRVVVTIAALSVVLAAIAGTSSASHSGGSGPKLDFVRGATEQGPSKARFSARKTGPAPTDVRGDFSARGDFNGDGRPDFTIAGPVTCLQVVGDRAGFFYRVTRSSNPALENNSGVFIYLEDNDPSSSVPDEMGFTGPVPITATSSCPYVNSQPIDRGNVVVHDGDASGGGRPPVSGSAGDDTIQGTSGDDVINCGAGDDRVNAGAGDDVINCGSGNDVVFGGSGDDRISGGEGSDELHGESGNDRIDGGPSKDNTFGGSGTDTFSGAEGRQD